jgi:hypothetical protein
MTLQEILDNAAYGDDTSFVQGDLTMKLGDLRAFRKLADGEKQTAAAKRAEAEKLARDAAALLQSLEEQAKRVPQPKNEGNEPDWRKDPFYQPVAAEIDKVNGIVEKINAALAAQQKSLDNASAIYALERMRNQFDRVKDKVKGKSFEDLAKQAVAEGVKDNYGLPTLDPIIDRLMEPERIKAAQETAVQEARAKWEQEQAAANISKPGSSARFRNKSDSKPPVSRIEDITSEMVMNDPDVRAAMEGTGTN